MRVYIDEAGVFLPPTSHPYSFSLVLGLVVPSSVEAELFYEFLRLRDSWPAKLSKSKAVLSTSDRPPKLSSSSAATVLLWSFSPSTWIHIGRTLSMTSRQAKH